MAHVGVGVIEWSYCMIAISESVVGQLWCWRDWRLLFDARIRMLHRVFAVRQFGFITYLLMLIVLCGSFA